MNTLDKIFEYLNIQCFTHLVAHLTVFISLYLINLSFFQYMTEKLTLGTQSSLLGGKAVGDFPCGIPVNIQITGEWCEFLWCCINFYFLDYAPSFVAAFDFFCCWISQFHAVDLYTISTGTYWLAYSITVHHSVFSGNRIVISIAWQILNITQLHLKIIFNLLGCCVLQCFSVQSGFLSYCTDCPPVLFEVTCSNNSVQIGGFPWHYIYTPPHKTHKGTHHICSLKDSTLVGLTIPLYIQYTISIIIWSFGSKLQHVLMIMDKYP